MRVVVSVLVLAALGLAVYVLVADNGETGAPTIPELDADEAALGLEGRAADSGMELDPYATIVDWRELVKALAAAKPDARWNERVTELAAGRSAMIDELIDALRERYDADRQATGLHVVWVQQALAALGASAVPQMVAALEDPEAKLRERMIGVLLVLGPKAAPAIPVAMRVAKDANADPHERGWMISLLGTIGPESKAVLPFLHALLRHEDAHEYLEETGVVALQRIDGASEEVFETYAILLRGEWLAVRNAILHIVIDDMKGEAAPLVYDVLALLDNEVDERLHPLAIRALQAIGKADPSVVAKLGAWVEEPPYRDARESACRALAQLGEPGQEQVARLADTDDIHLRSITVNALGEFHAPARLVLALVGPLLENEYEGYRMIGLAALGRVSADTATAWPLIEPFLESESDDERACAAGALFALRDPTPAVLGRVDAILAAEAASLYTGALATADLATVSHPALVARLFSAGTSDVIGHRRGFAYAAQTASGALEGRAIDALIGLLGDEDVSTITQAIESLGQLGERARRAIEPLRRLRAVAARDPDRRYLLWLLDRSIQDIESGITTG